MSKISTVFDQTLKDWARTTLFSPPLEDWARGDKGSYVLELRPPLTDVQKRAIGAQLLMLGIRDGLAALHSTASTTMLTIDERPFQRHIARRYEREHAQVTSPIDVIYSKNACTLLFGDGWRGWKPIAYDDLGNPDPLGINPIAYERVIPNRTGRSGRVVPPAMKEAIGAELAKIGIKDALVSIDDAQTMTVGITSEQYKEHLEPALLEREACASKGTPAGRCGR